MKERKGYVFEENGKWFARLTFTDSTGKRRNIKRTAKSKADANGILKKILRQIEDEGTQVIDSLKVTFGELADFYEANYAKPARIVNNQKVEGLRDYKRVICFLSIFRQHFGKRKLRDITYADLTAFRAQRLQTTTQYGKPRTITTVNRELSALRRIFNVAVQQNWLLKNPFNCGDSLILISCERRREKILTLDEEIRLLKACEHPQRQHLKPLLITLLDTGCRKGEILSLVWRDVDFENGVITVQAENTKTLKKRQVPITKRLFDELNALWEHSDKLPDSTVFGISEGVRKSFATACRIAEIKHGGIDGLTLHNLRHTAATRLVQGQLPIQMVGRILGHTQPQTTYRYISANESVSEKVKSIFEAIQV